MKTIIITHNYSQETFAVMSYNLAHNLSNKNYRVIFISHKPYFEEVFLDKNVLVYSWPTPNRPTSIKDAVWFAKMVLKYKPNVIISHFGSVNITLIVAKILSLWKIKTLPYYHTLSSQLNIDSKEKAILKKIKKIRKYVIYKFFSDKIICPSEFSKNDLANYFSIKKGVKILNPMQDRFQTQTNVINDENIVLSFLGRIDKSKGIYVLLEAFDLYCKQNVTTRIRLNIAGSGTEEDKVKDIVRLNPNVNYIGGLTYDKVDAFLQEGRYTILPSLSDNLPTVGIESLMNGIPLLISENTGLTQELNDTQDSFSFFPIESDLIKLFSDLENNIYNYDVLKKNARETYLEKFSMNTYFSAIVELIET